MMPEGTKKYVRKNRPIAPAARIANPLPFQLTFSVPGITPATPTTLDLMLLSKKNHFDFSKATWATVSHLPFFAGGVDPAIAQGRYENLMSTKPKVLAALLNITRAMSQIFLAQGTPLQYLKQIIWDDSMAQDRFFAYCDTALIDQVRQAAKRGLFAPEFGSGFFHPGATASWKQVQFGEANVQLTFHEGSKQTIDGVNCIVSRARYRYFKDLGTNSGSVRPPVIVYVLRWIAGKHAGVPEFNPPYTIVKSKIRRFAGGPKHGCSRRLCSVGARPGRAAQIPYARAGGPWKLREESCARSFRRHYRRGHHTDRQDER
jgi:hypothetical protein